MLQDFINSASEAACEYDLHFKTRNLRQGDGYEAAEISLCTDEDDNNDIHDWVTVRTTSLTHAATSGRQREMVVVLWKKRDNSFCNTPHDLFAVFYV